MANYSIYALGSSQISVTGGKTISGNTQGAGTHLQGETITLNSNAWQSMNIADDGTDTAFADNDGNQTLNGQQTFDGVTYAAGRVVEAEYRVTVQAPDGTTYTLIGFNIREPGAPNSYGTTEGLAFIGSFPPVGVPLTVLSTSEGPSNSGANSTESGTYAVPPCFVAGTLIDTDTGPRAIEDLGPGSRVWTADDGYQPLRLSLQTSFSPAQLRADRSLRPVIIDAGALGPGLPERALSVSQQHRILLDDWRAQLFCGEDQVLSAAKHLLNDTTVRVAPVDGPVTYFHLVFDRHQIVASAGLLSESFYPGPRAMAAIPQSAKAEFFAFFPHLAASLTGYGQSARREAAGPEAVLLAA